MGTFGWIDVFDQDGTRYGVNKDTYSDNIYWANKLKPNNYEIIEEYLTENAEELPLPLQDVEHDKVIEFIKKILPNKKDFYIKIDDSMYLPSRDGVIYDVYESKLTPEQEEILIKDLLEKYDEDEAYYKLGESKLTPLGEEHEFSIYDALVVTNDKIVISMDNGKKYEYKRDYNKAKQYKVRRERIEREELERINREYQEREQLRRESASKHNLTLSNDYDGNIYRIQDEYTFLDNMSYDEMMSKKELILKDYMKIKDLISLYDLDITTSKFNNVLKELNFIYKEKTLNKNNWIVKDNGLDYGINLIKVSHYMHKSIPSWYKIKIFDYEQQKLTDFNHNEYVKLTDPLWNKNKFSDLYNQVLEYSKVKKQERKEKINEPKLPNKVQIEREKWLRHITCPKCGEENNIHKKDKRKRYEFTVQRFYCNECNSMFQIDVEKLEKMIQEYDINNKEEEKEEIEKSERTDEIQKENLESIKHFSDNKKKSILKRIFPFFK